MADEFLDAIMQRSAGTGFDIQYSNKYARPTLEKLAADVRSKMDTASKTDRPAKRKRLVNVRSQIVKPTPEEQAYKDYDDARQKLATFLGETLNTPKGVSDKNAALTGIVDAVSKGRREQQYAAPATSTPESPVPAPVPSARTTPYQRATADVKAGDVKIEGLGYQNNAPEMSEAESTGYAKLESSMSPEGVEVGTRPPETVKLESSMFPEGVEIAATSPSTAMAEAPTKAAPVELDENRMAQLYRKTTGAVYNPEVSKAAREKMAQLKSFVSSNPEMLNKSDTKIALDFYRTL